MGDGVVEAHIDAGIFRNAAAEVGSAEVERVGWGRSKGVEVRFLLPPAKTTRQSSHPFFALAGTLCSLKAAAACVCGGEGKLGEWSTTKVL